MSIIQGEGERMTDEDVVTFSIQARGIGRMMYTEQHCRWRKKGICAHPESSVNRKYCPWTEPPTSLQDWYPCMFAEVLYR